MVQQKEAHLRLKFIHVTLTVVTKSLDVLAAGRDSRYILYADTRESYSTDSTRREKKSTAMRDQTPHETSGAAGKTSTGAAALAGALRLPVAISRIRTEKVATLAGSRSAVSSRTKAHSSRTLKWASRRVSGTMLCDWLREKS